MYLLKIPLCTDISKLYVKLMDKIRQIMSRTLPNKSDDISIRKAKSDLTSDEDGFDLDLDVSQNLGLMDSRRLQQINLPFKIKFPIITAPLSMAN